MFAFLIFFLLLPMSSGLFYTILWKFCKDCSIKEIPAKTPKLVRTVIDLLTVISGLGAIVSELSDEEKFSDGFGVFTGFLACAGGVIDAWEDGKLSPLDIVTAFYTGLSLGFYVGGLI